MTQYTRPSASVPVWAESGDKVQPTNQEVQTGWPLSATPPSRQRFNWVLNFIAQAARYLLQRGIAEWAATEDYPQYGRCSYNGVTYRALISSPTSAPGVVSGEWEVWGYTDSTIEQRIDQALTKSVAGNADVTLTQAEANNGLLIFTGALTGNINVIVPNQARRWAIINSTTGSFSLSLKTTSGAAVATTQGKAVSAYCDGNNVCGLSGAANSVAVQTVQITATAGQTSFQISGGYTVGTVNLVTRNGADVGFTASDGANVVLSVAASLNDLVKVYIFAGFTVSNAVSKGGDTMTGSLTMSGAPINQAQGANIASAATLNLSATTGNFVHVTGTTAITAISLGQGSERTVTFDGALTLTNGASLILPSGANIITAAGDTAVFRGEGSGVVRCVSYQKADGKALVASSFAKSQIRVNTANGYGSTNTMIRRFTNVVENSGADITYADSATAGSSFTINTTGRYSISFSECLSGNNAFGITLNSSQLTTSISNAGLNLASRVSMGNCNAANTFGNCGATLALTAGDVIRPHNDGASAGSLPCVFSITRVG